MRLHSRFAKAAVTAVVVASAMVATSTNTAATWWQNDILWFVTPSGSSVGDCFGNCGAGCSDSVNPCGGPQQYWELNFIAGPDLAQTLNYQVCENNPDTGSYEGYLVDYTTEEYHAIGRWTYHGFLKSGCWQHDGVCNQWLIGCVLYFGCGEEGGPREWQYDEWMTGHKTWETSRTWVSYC